MIRKDDADLRNSNNLSSINLFSNSLLSASEGVYLGITQVCLLKVLFLTLPSMMFFPCQPLEYPTEGGGLMGHILAEKVSVVNWKLLPVIIDLNLSIKKMLS